MRIIRSTAFLAIICLIIYSDASHAIGAYYLETNRYRAPVFSVAAGCLAELGVDNWTGEYEVYDSSSWVCRCYSNPNNNCSFVMLRVYTKEESPKNNGSQCQATNNGTNPINVTTGNKYQHEIDYISSNSFNFERHYNSRDLQNSRRMLGLGWRSNYSRKLTLYHFDGMRNDIVVIMRPDGKNVYFESIDGSWIIEPNSNGTLTEIFDNGNTVGWRYTLDAGNFEEYDNNGRLVFINQQGTRQETLEYNENDRLISVTDNVGKQLTLVYGTNARLETLIVPGGKSFAYRYDEHGNLVSAIYPDSTPDNLNDNPTRTYHYKDTRFKHALTGITDTNGNRYATWQYDDEGKAFSSEYADGVNVHSVAYSSDNSVTVTNSLGKETTYHYTDIHGVRKITHVEGHASTNCAAAHKSYTYDANGRISSKAGWSGNITTFVDRKSVV